MFTSTNRFPALIVTLTAMLSGCHQSAIHPDWPPVENSARPWARWWWPGNAVTREGITLELEAFKDSGFGGVEITPIYGVKGFEDQFVPYLSEAWVNLLAHTLSEARRLDLGVDMATGTGWPFGGPWVSAGDACKYVAHRIYHVGGGDRLREPIRYMQEPLLRAVGGLPYTARGIYNIGEDRPEAVPAAYRPISIDQLVEPISANQNLQALALDQVRFGKELPLQALMAYSGNGDALNLTDSVEANGHLRWIAPPGRWTLYAVFEGWHGKMVERAAPGGEGNVIDHFSHPAISDYLARFDSAFAMRSLDSLRCFFNDSYEVDDARGMANWTPGLFDEFMKRRGYDLRLQLPALFGNDTPERNERVLCDYRKTISELLLDNFTDPWKNWAHAKGAMVRNQAHGSPANILDLYAASDIPETEGTEIMRFKMASSAAHVSGKNLVSSETITWLNEHFMTTLADIRHAVDQVFLGGVNHVFYHGTCYSPPREEWPGWLFYAAVHVDSRNPIWNDIAKLNDYIARCQAFLQSGTSDNNVLLYFPIDDQFSKRGPGLLAHFDGGLEDFDSTTFKEAAGELWDKGYAFDLISDRQILDLAYADKQLKTAGGGYEVLIVPHSKYIPDATFAKLLDLASQGATIIAYEGLPDHVSGFFDNANKEQQFQQSKLQFTSARGAGTQQATVGERKVLSGRDLSSLLELAEVPRESLADTGLEFVRRATGQGTTYFIYNAGTAPVDGWVPFSTRGSGSYVFDPMTLENGVAACRKADEAVEVNLHLDPGQSLIVEILTDPVDGKRYPYFLQKGTPVPLAGPWHISFIEGGPAVPGDRDLDSLGSWTALGGDTVKWFSGSAVYGTTFEMPKGPSDGWRLDLGSVKESAEVRINGKVISTLIGPPYSVRLDPGLLKAENVLEVRVTNLAANRIADLDRRGVRWKKFYNVNFPARLPENRRNGLFDASAWGPGPSGLIGPVTLTPESAREVR